MFRTVAARSRGQPTASITAPPSAASLDTGQHIVAVQTAVFT